MHPLIMDLETRYFMLGSEFSEPFSYPERRVSMSNILFSEYNGPVLVYPSSTGLKNCPVPFTHESKLSLPPDLL